MIALALHPVSYMKRTKKGSFHQNTHNKPNVQMKYKDSVFCSSIVVLSDVFFAFMMLLLLFVFYLYRIY